MLIDMHIHTYRYSGCSILDPVDIVRRAEELHLSGIVLTEHDYVWTSGAIEELKRETMTDILILRGQEVSSPAGHALVYGCYDSLDHLSVDELLKRVHEKGGVVMPSHPFRYGDFATDSIETLKLQLAHYDGFEALNGNQNHRQNAFGMNAWKTLGMIGIGGSDAHSVDMIGSYVTEFRNQIKDENDLVTELKAGRCKPVNRHECIAI